jgi:hypothetical protein
LKILKQNFISFVSCLIILKLFILLYFAHPPLN